MQLKPGTLLQGGKYRILRTLGQGGFGITYEAEQILLHRKVAVKEFFMKDCCERDDDTSYLMVGTGNQQKLVEKFQGKFIREAQMIAGMEHSHIIRVTDVFEENNTAYYVMDYLPGGSLSDKVKKDGPLSEAKAEKYIRQVADALDYIHSQNTVHLDVKPSNILLNAKGEAILIDFGISKHYDDSGDQTSSTPVGISKGYAPLEQGRDGDINQFKPSTDIYALGATLYYLASGLVPPEASIVNEDGLKRPDGLSGHLWHVIEQSMRPRRKDRPQNIDAFLSLLDDCSFEDDVEEKTTVKVLKAPNNQSHPHKNKTWLWVVLAGLVTCGIVFLFLLNSNKNQEKALESDTTWDVANISLPTELSHVEESIVENYRVLDPKGNLIYVYTGSIKNGIPNGQGKALYPDGRKYEGEFVNGKRDSKKASFVFSDGNVYEGSFVDDHLGTGRLTSKQQNSYGTYFVGEFSDDKPFKGIWYDKNGKIISELN